MKGTPQKGHCQKGRGKTFNYKNYHSKVMFLFCMALIYIFKTVTITCGKMNKNKHDNAWRQNYQGK